MLEFVRDYEIVQRQNKVKLSYGIIACYFRIQGTKIFFFTTKLTKTQTPHSASTLTTNSLEL